MSNTSRISALYDLLIIVFVLVAVKQSVLLFSFLLAGPASTLMAMLVATILLQRRDFAWKDLGFRWPEKGVKSWLKILGLTVLTWRFLLFVNCKHYRERW